VIIVFEKERKRNKKDERKEGSWKEVSKSQQRAEKEK
jgi:hypothetical protein